VTAAGLLQQYLQPDFHAVKMADIDTRGATRTHSTRDLAIREQTAVLHRV